LFLGCSYTKEVKEEIKRENPVAGGLPVDLTLSQAGGRR
jgi:hypothetical protein